MVQAVTDTSCSVFGALSAPLDPDAIHRFVVGEDEAVRALSADEASAELGDPFATLVLLRGVFPHTPVQTLDTLSRAAIHSGFALPRKPTFFVLGEGSQLPVSEATRRAERNVRFLAAVGSGDEGPDVLISAFDPEHGDVELMAWDPRAGGFNFYRTVGPSSAWVFAGNSAHALAPATEGKGPFESHRSGNFLMKELRSPWINWHTQDARIDPSIFAAGDARGEHPWFTAKVPQGALACEMEVARPSIERWTAARFNALLADGATIERPARIMEQILDTPTVNLISSHTRNADARSVSEVDLPNTFFVDSEALSKMLGLRKPPAFAVTPDVYAASLAAFDVALDDGRGFRQPGDTHFVFVVPERAFEDQIVVREAMRIGLLNDRLAASLLMTDFANPVFSTRRRKLLDHVPATAAIANGESDFSEELANAIVAAVPDTPQASPEREFEQRWAAGDGWRDAFDALLGDYYDAATQRLTDQDGFDAVFRLAESRRNRVRAMAIFESPLLFARTNITPEVLAMRPDASVVAQG
ncbi:MAG: hypothetical protein M3401_02345 [Actinomycetota bacterium]|nr:hypothetical protein [Actinomycetota bacterium]